MLLADSSKVNLSKINFDFFFPQHHTAWVKGGKREKPLNFH